MDGFLFGLKWSKIDAGASQKIGKLDLFCWKNVFFLLLKELKGDNDEGCLILEQKFGSVWARAKKSNLFS